MTLSNLEALARAVTAESAKGLGNRYATWDAKDAFYDACRPETVLRLIAVAKAAMAEIDSICRCPDCKAEGNGESELMRAVDALEKP